MKARRRSGGARRRATPAAVCVLVGVGAWGCGASSADTGEPSPEEPPLAAGEGGPGTETLHGGSATDSASAEGAAGEAGAGGETGVTDPQPESFTDDASDLLPGDDAATRPASQPEPENPQGMTPSQETSVDVGGSTSPGGPMDGGVDEPPPDVPNLGVELRPCDGPVDFEDPALEALVRWELGGARAVPFEGDITQEQAASLTELNAGVFSVAEARLESLNGLECLVGLSSLDLQYNVGIVDLAPVEALTNLTVLRLGSTSVEDLSPLRSLSGLTTLQVGSDAVSDLSPLADLTSLTFLELSSANIRDLTPLADLTSLTLLQVSSDHLNDLSPLSSLEGLSILRISGMSEVDASPLGSLVNLSELFLSSPVDDLSWLRSLTQLMTLRLANAGRPDLSVLSPLTRLSDLTITDTTISDVRPLSPLSRLSRLEIERAGLSDLSGLDALTGLTRLVLRENEIVELGPLAPLAQLEWLWLDDNEISDLAPLGGLRALRSLLLTNNDVSDVGPLADANFTELDLVDLEGNPIDCVAQAENLDRIFINGAVPHVDCD